MKDKIDFILKKISIAATKVGKTLSDITLVAVSKTFPVEDIISAYNCGLKIFGENRVNEAVSKIEMLKSYPDMEFHLIGHLQTNKIKLVDAHFSLIQSVDSIDLSEKLNRYFEKNKRVQDILVQVNLVNEPQKFGVKVDELEALLGALLEMEYLRLRGLMFIPPYCEDPEINRPNFKKMYELYENIKKKYTHFNDFNTLSMGMSGDFEVAIEEGANMVRIGTAIFGRR
jgi:pyridoxal phosphate enzyme (YggS family)